MQFLILTSQSDLQSVNCVKKNNSAANLCGRDATTKKLLFSARFCVVKMVQKQIVCVEKQFPN